MGKAGNSKILNFPLSPLIFYVLAEKAPTGPGPLRGPLGHATAPKTSMLALLKRVKKLPKNIVGQLIDYVPDLHVKNQLQPDIYMYSVCLHLTN